MDKIKCSVNNCSHNESGICFADRVNIVGYGASDREDTCCGSFLDRRTYSTLTNNVKGGGACTCLICKAEECEHNKNNICMLNTIQVTGNNDVNIYSETFCGSFKNCNK